MQLAAPGCRGPRSARCGRSLRPAAAGWTSTRLEHASDEEVHAALTEVTGIGPWTADVYILFCLGRADGWAPGDLALQVAAQRALELDERPDKEEMLSSPSAGGPGAASPPGCCGPTTPPSKQQRTAVPV